MLCRLALILPVLAHSWSPELRADTRKLLKQGDEWFQSGEAKVAAANILSYQSDYGGWPKNIDVAAKPFAGLPGDLVAEYKPSLDNSATPGETRFMARMFHATSDPRYKESVERAIDYILIAQYPTGGWPQSYPPDSQYHRHITYNDDAMVRVLQLLREVGEGKLFGFIDPERRAASRAAFWHGIECIVKCQVRVDGKLTGWGAQHDETTLVPRRGRRFEPASLSGAESVGIVRLLMSLDPPAPEVIAAIRAAMDWFVSARIDGWRVEQREGKWAASQDAGAPPLWARFYDIKSGRPLFADEEGKLSVGIQAIAATRLGYDWTGRWPERLIEKDFPAWEEKIAASGAGPAISVPESEVRIALAGDSTVTDGAGWGFGFKKTLKLDARCRNFAQGGQSTKSFRDSGWWNRTLEWKPDYVLIQFGHNDMPGKGPHRETDPETTYAENLERFVREARAAGIKPVLVTSLARRIFEANGKLRGELAPYVSAARRVAAEQRVPLIDLFAKSVAISEKLGLDGVEPFEPKTRRKPSNAPSPSATEARDGVQGADIDVSVPQGELSRDATHLNARGSIAFGRIVADELGRVVPELKSLLK